MTDYVELRFPLAVEDGWPPVSVEGLPFRTTSGGYVSTTPPLFVKNLSVGDVIKAEMDDNGMVESWQHVSKSTNSVVWLLRIGKTDEIDGALERLRSLGCSTAKLPSAGSYSIDVPGDVSISDVDAVLATLDSTKVAIAYPSFRHAERINAHEGGRVRR
jgi:hypothetical protein